jgi:hypothetical protein
MSDVQVRRSRVKADFDIQWSTELQFRFQPAFGKNLVGAARKLCNLFFNTRHLNFWLVYSRGTVALNSTAVDPFRGVNETIENETHDLSLRL